MKKIIIYIIKVFGLMLMLLSSYNFSKNVGALSVSDPAYVIGFIIGALIPMVIGYFLFRLKVDNKSAVKKFSENERDSKQEGISLVEYVKPFDTFQSQRDLEKAGLWWHKVYVKQIPERFEGTIEKNDSYYIGWEYPSSASLYDMSMELPVMFTKLDGSTLSLGISLDDLELVTQLEK